jgi:hypothetical protein
MLFFNFAVKSLRNQVSTKIFRKTRKNTEFLAISVNNFSNTVNSVGFSRGDCRPAQLVLLGMILIAQKAKIHGYNNTNILPFSNYCIVHLCR